MARISDTELSRLKAEISLVRLVEARGIELRKHGSGDLIGRCPFHDDKTPSLVVSPKKNLWHCLGACDTGGSVIDWTMKCEGVSFRHAVDLLREDAGLSDSLPKGRNGSKVAKHSTVPKLAAPTTAGAEDAVLLSQVVDYYHQAIKESPEALSYLAARGLNHPELIASFKLGFANRTLGYRLPQKNRQAGAQARSTLTRLGIIRKSGHEHFNGSIVVPIFAEDGSVAEMYGRKITSNLRKGTPKHLYLPGAHAGLFNWQALGTSKEVILCESIIDAMTFWCAGYRNVTASYGTSGFTDEHLAAFKRHGIGTVMIAYDRDDAGTIAAKYLAARLLDEGINVYGVQFPKGMDANEYALKMQPAEKALELVLRKAVWMAQARFPNVTPQPDASWDVPKDAPKAEIPEAPRLSKETEKSRAEETASLAAPGTDVAAAITESPEAPRLSKETEKSQAEETSSFVAPSPGGERVAEPAVNMEQSDREMCFTFGDRRVRIRGLEKNRSYDQLKVNVLFGRGEAFFVDTVDLYAARHRAAFIKQAAEELEVAADVIKKDLGRVLLKLEAVQEAAIEATLAPAEERVVLSEAEKSEALELLRDPSLLSRILADFEACGVVGEETNKLAGYLGVISRKLDKPLAMIVQSTSAAGKSALMESVLAFVPKEERIKYSAMTGQSLYYLGEESLKHRVLAVVEEEGAERASYALKLLQSEGELTIASTGKDPQTGKLVTSEYHVEGPVMLFLTTTAIEIDEELLNRCLVLTVDEGAEQTAAIHKKQRQSRTLKGLLGRTQKTSVLTLHQNAQRLLRSLAVVNPFAEELTFASHKTRMRRDHMKYLTLIDTITLLHQHQREIKSVTTGGQVLEYIEVTRDDIEVANRLSKQLLGRSLDELPPQTRTLLGLIDGLVGQLAAKEDMDLCAVRFSRRNVREATGWGNTQLKVHLARLLEMEFLGLHRGPNGRFLYELCCVSGEDSGAVLGICDYDLNRPGLGVNRSAPGRGVVGPQSAPSRSVDSAEFEQYKANTPDVRNGASEGTYPVATSAAVLS